MIPYALKIDGSLAGVDPLLVMVAAAVTVAVIVMTAVVARQLQRLQPKAPPPSQVQKASGEFDAWTERPKAQSDKDQEYYSLYGSQPGRPVTAGSSRGPPAPPAPLSPMGNVMVDLSGAAPAKPDAWVDAADAPQGFAAPPAPHLHPPARPTGPSDEIVAPSHGRRVRDTSTGEMPPRETARPPFERYSVEPGAVTPAPSPGDPFSPRAAAPPAPPPPPPPPKIATAKIAETLPGVLPTTAAKAAFRGPSRGQTVVGAGTTGIQEGTVISPEKKAIRCPKCQTVFAGPVTRPATVKCPACGTTGNLR